MRTKTVLVKEVGQQPYLLTASVKDIEQVMTNLIGETPSSVIYRVVDGNPAICIIHKVVEDNKPLNFKTNRNYHVVGTAIFVIYTHNQIFSLGEHEVRAICRQYGWTYPPQAQ